MEPDYYAALGVSRDAPPDDVKHAFTRLAKEVHPDVNPSPAAAARFQSVMEAFEVLREPRLRAIYDARRNPAVNSGYDDASMRARGAAFDRARRAGLDAAAAESAAESAAFSSHPGARAFTSAMRFVEQALRPRSLIGATLLFGGAWLLMDSVGGGGNDVYGDTSTHVPAWWNAETKRFETPAPWSPAYAVGRHTTRMVKRHLVTVATPPSSETVAVAAAGVVVITKTDEAKVVDKAALASSSSSSLSSSSSSILVDGRNSSKQLETPPHGASVTQAEEEISKKKTALAVAAAAASRSGRSEIVLR
jgi:hypothetical protein